jgi:hypothetical protein
MPAAIIRPPSGAPAPGTQNWVSFWRNQFAGMPHYPLGGQTRSHLLGALPTHRPAVPGAADAIRPALTTPITHPNAVGPGKIVNFGSLHPLGHLTSPWQGQTPGSGGVPPVSVPPVGAGGPPNVLGPPDWGRYLMGFMAGYHS